MSRLKSSRNLLVAPMVIRMVVAVWKHLQIIKAIILDNFDFKIFPKKTIPWACPGSGPPRNYCTSHTDQVRKSGSLSIRRSSSGQGLSKGTSYTYMPGLDA